MVPLSSTYVKHLNIIVSVKSDVFIHNIYTNRTSLFTIDHADFSCNLS